MGGTESNSVFKGFVMMMGEAIYWGITETGHVTGVTASSMNIFDQINKVEKYRIQYSNPPLIFKNPKEQKHQLINPNKNFT